MQAHFVVGIDVALREHRVAVLGSDGEAVGASFSVESSRDGLERLARTLRERGAKPGDTVVGVEASGHLWENLYAHLVAAGYRVVVLNPLQTRRWRDVVRKKAKTDDIDAHLIAGLIRSGQAEPSYVPDEQVQSLRDLARLRASLGRERQDYLRQLVSVLEVVLPEHHELLGDLTSARARGILRAFPTARDLAQASPAAIERAAREAGARGFSRQDAQAVRDGAKRSAYGGRAVSARGQVVRVLVQQIERIGTSLDSLDAAMTEILHAASPGDDSGPTDAEILEGIPGIGPHTAATLLGELGRVTRFRDARALVAYVGFFPAIFQSGQQQPTPRISPVGSRVVRHALYMAAVNAIRRSAEFRTLYLRKRSQGKPAKQALVVVAVKLLHVIHALLKRRSHFDPSRLLVASCPT